MSHWVAALHTYAITADALFVMLVVVGGTVPQPFRPWYRAAFLLGCTQFAPTSSRFAWLLWTAPLTLAAALVLTLRNPDAFREES